MVEIDELFFKKEELIEFSKEVLLNVEVPNEDAEIISRFLVKTEQRGIHTHGLIRLPIYIKRIIAGLANPTGKMEIVKDINCSAIIDAKDCLGHISSYRAMNLAIKKARKFSIGAVSVKNSQHFGEAALYPLMAVENDMIGFSTTNVFPLMAPTGGVERMLGNNPFSYGIPAGEEYPIVLDIACTVAAAGKIMLKGKLGEKIPLGWAIDKDGNPIEDAKDFLPKEGSSLLPISMHKGYGLALVMDILSGALSGSALGLELDSLYNLNTTDKLRVGHFFMALNINNFVPIDEFKTRVDKRIREIRNSKKKPNIKRIYIPGEIEFENKRNSDSKNISIPISVVKDLENIAIEVGLNKKLH